MTRGEANNNTNNVKSQENRVEQLVLDSIARIEKSVSEIKTTEDDLKWNVTDNFSNPTKEEIMALLNKIPSTQAHYNNIKVYAQFLLDRAEHELYVAQVNARNEFKTVHMQRIQNYQNEIARSFENALRSTSGDKAIKAVESMIKAFKPKDPTENEIQAYIAEKTQVQSKQVIAHRYRLNKLKEFCKVLDNKFSAVKSLSYTIEDTTNIDKNYSKYSV